MFCSPLEPTRKFIVLVQWEDAKQFFNPWACKPNSWECKIGIASSNNSFSFSETSSVLPKVSGSYEMQDTNGIIPLNIALILK